MKINNGFLLGLLIQIAFFPRLAQAAEFAVSPAADADCADLVCDLQSALNAAAQNKQDDVIVLEEGTYSVSSNGGVSFAYQPVDNYEHPEENEAFSLHIRGTSATTVILTGENLNPVLAIEVPAVPPEVPSPTVSVEGVTVREGAGRYGVVRAAGLSIESRGGSIMVQDCLFQDNVSSVGGTGGLDVFTTGDVSLRNSTFSKNSSTGDAVGGATLYGGTVDVGGNVFVQNRSASGDAGGVSVYAADLNFSNNVMEENSSDSYGAGGALLNVSGYDSVVTNNIFFKNEGGARITTAGVHAVLSNNSIVDNSNFGLSVYAGTDDAAVVVVEAFNNIAFNNTGGDGEKNDIQYKWEAFNSGGDSNGQTFQFRLLNNNFGSFRKAECSFGCPDIDKQESSTINADPLFIDAANGDFHLGSNSPCIDAGIEDTSFTLPEFDLDGNARILGTAPDMGAYEFDINNSGGVGTPDGSSSGGTGSGSSGGCSLVR